MNAIIDRFEGRYAVVETDDGKMHNIDKSLLPNAKEGDKIIITAEEPAPDEDTYTLFKRLMKD